MKRKHRTPKGVKHKQGPRHHKGDGPNTGRRRAGSFFNELHGRPEGRRDPKRMWLPGYLDHYGEK